MSPTRDSPTTHVVTVSSSDADSVANSPTGYLGSLDGIRGVGALLVFAFHAGYGWATGGFLGVSVFFTLSGFLITTLLLRESGRTGTVDLWRFAKGPSRRPRRRVPTRRNFRPEWGSTAIPLR